MNDPFRIEVREQETVDWRIVLIGLTFFIIRLIAMNGLKLADGSFHPRIFHTSNFVHLCFCFALIGSLRYKVFNAVPLTAMPTMLISMLLQDIPAVFIYEVNGLYKLYYGLGHLPPFLLCFYLIYTRKYLLSKSSYWFALLLTGLWFLIIDDKINGSLDGWTFFFIGTTAHVIWGLLVHWRMPKNEIGDKWIAPLIRLAKKETIIVAEN
jgi:hypothetical protein